MSSEDIKRKKAEDESYAELVRLTQTLPDAPVTISTKVGVSVGAQWLWVGDAAAVLIVLPCRSSRCRLESRRSVSGGRPKRRSPRLRFISSRTK